MVSFFMFTFASIVVVFQLAAVASLASWQECSIFLAPSSTGGYGVFAGRDFIKNEIVELAPFFLAVEHTSPFVIHTALQDYIYGYMRVFEDGSNVTLAAIVWGMTMWYNHHPTAQNVDWFIFGSETSPTDYFRHPYVQAVGFIALRDIRAGEELFSTYGSEDGGANWFQHRLIQMAETSLESTTSLSPVQLNQYMQEYCSKMYAGMDQWVYQRRLRAIQRDDFPHVIATERLIPQSSFQDYENPDYPWAVAKVPIAKGDRIELAPALVLDRNSVVESLMAPLVYYWEDLTEDLQTSVRELRQLGYYVVQYQGPDNDWHRENRFTSLEESVILPAAGWIGRIQRVGNHATDTTGPNSLRANCYMTIRASSPKATTTSTPSTTTTTTTTTTSGADSSATPFSTGNAGILIELTASHDVAVGERIRINLPPPSVTFKEQLALYKEIERSGQLYGPSRTSSKYEIIDDDATEMDDEEHYQEDEL